uniref:Transposon Ty3-I Gag-Pol polyprotein n=1 Tax=Cajanus cajan TaxID=3821 RepID=A0A151SFJ4_CAJCA|nr:Transposon Ty3-I Gag-Pol polyprotein [Cajanus cajan]
MLQQGIIQPKTSPFSSPTVLLKKKNGTWRFCTDYRALNAITIKDSFPMPTVHYEWLVMPFGLKNAPTTFQSMINQIFQDVLSKYVAVFFDNILIYSPTCSDHLEHLEAVLQTLRLQVLFVKLSKCSFGMLEVGVFVSQSRGRVLL